MPSEPDRGRGPLGAGVTWDLLPAGQGFRPSLLVTWFRVRSDGLAAPGPQTWLLSMGPSALQDHGNKASALIRDTTGGGMASQPEKGSANADEWKLLNVTSHGAQGGM